MTITMDVLKEYAPIYFKQTKKHLNTINAIREFTGNYEAGNAQVESFMKLSGMSTYDLMGKYNDDMLKSDPFRMMVILYTSICIVSKRKDLSSEEFGGYSIMLKNIIGSELDHSALLQYISDKIGVDATLVPSYVKIGVAKAAEERDANKICDSQMNLIRRPNPEEEFDSYYTYMNGKAADLIQTLNKAGYMHSFEQEKLTFMMVLRKLGLRMFQLYDIDMNLPFPEEVSRELAKKVFELNSRGFISGDIDISRM